MGVFDDWLSGKTAQRDRMIDEANNRRQSIIDNANAACPVDLRLPASQTDGTGGLNWSAINTDSALAGVVGIFCSLFSGNRDENHNGDSNFVQVGNTTCTIQGNLIHNRRGDVTRTLIGTYTFNHIGNHLLNRTGTEITTNYGAVTRTFISPVTEAHAATRNVMQPTSVYRVEAFSLQVIYILNQNNTTARVRFMGSDNRLTIQKFDVVGLKTELKTTDLGVAAFKTDAAGFKGLAQLVKGRASGGEVAARVGEARAGADVQAPPCSLGAE